MSASSGPQNVITDELEIIDLFRLLFKKKEKLWLWQENPENPRGRSIHLCLVRKVDVLKNQVWLSPLGQANFAFKVGGADLFLYSRERNLAMKFSPREMEATYVCLDFPKRINMVSEELADKLNLIEKENEKDNEGKREAPRKQAKGKQTLKAYRYLNGNPDNFQIYEIHDISAGGVAVKCEDPGTFALNEVIVISSINGEPLKKTLYAQVMSIRHLEELDIFKAGMKFLDESELPPKA